MTQGQSANQPILITGTTNLSVSISDDTGYITNIGVLKAEAYNGHSQIDIHEIIRNLFHDDRTLIVNNGYIKVWKDYNLSAYTHINGTGYIFTRGIKQPTGNFAILGDHPTNGETTKATAQKRTLFSFYSNIANGRITAKNLPSGTEFTLYEGELIGAFTIESGDVFSRRLITIYNEDAAEPEVAFSFTSEITLTEEPNPFFVRWINQEGGWETFAFECKQENTKALTKNEYFQPFTEDTNPAVEFVNYSKEAKETVEVSSGMIDAEQYKRLSVLPYSPIIQLYDGTNWKNIQVEKGDSAWMTDQTTGEVLMTFQLPQPKIMK